LRNKLVSKLMVVLLFTMLMLGFNASGYGAGGRIIDVYTQRGGVGPNEPGGEFCLGEEVILDALVTYNGFPVQHKPVAFQVLNPSNGTAAVLTAFSDNNGLAEVNFNISELPSSVGVWTVVSTVEIASITVNDTVTFKVSPCLPVGGYALPLNTANTEKPSTLYLALFMVSTSLFIVFERETTIGRKRAKKDIDEN
jgi:hypothetical protein